jgi:hypothetical protein
MPPCQGRCRKRREIEFALSKRDLLAVLEIAQMHALNAGGVTREEGHRVRSATYAARIPLMAQ